MRVLLIDKNLVDPVHRGKWRRLAERPGLELTALAPERWVENFREIQCRPHPEDGFPLETIPVGWAGYENRGFFRGDLGKRIRRHRPHVVVAFEEPLGLMALQTTLATQGLRPRPRRAFYTWDNLTDGKTYPFRPSWFYRRVERAVGRRADHIWCANREACRRFARDYPGKARLLHFGLDLARFPARLREPATTGNSFHVGYVGRLLPMKGVETLIEALALLPVETRLTVVGNGPHRAALGAEAEHRGLSSRVRILEGVPSSAVAEEMASFHALVLPSRTTPHWKEQFGRVLVEAMAIGVPVIGSSSGSIPEVIGEAGLIFPEGNAAELAARLRHLRETPEERARLSIEGRRRAAEFGADRFAENAARLLEEMVAS